MHLMKGHLRTRGRHGCAHMLCDCVGKHQQGKTGWGLRSERPLSLRHSFSFVSFHYPIRSIPFSFLYIYLHLVVRSSHVHLYIYICIHTTHDHQESSSLGAGAVDLKRGGPGLAHLTGSRTMNHQLMIPLSTCEYFTSCIGKTIHDLRWVKKKINTYLVGQSFIYWMEFFLISVSSQRERMISIFCLIGRIKMDTIDHIVLGILLITL